MRKVRWSWTIAVALGTLAGICLPNCGQDNAASASAMGKGCPKGDIITSGVLNADQYHPNFRVVGGLMFVVNPDGIPALLLKQYHGKKVEIVVREIK
jgi:hypothetical protein